MEYIIKNEESLWATLEVVAENSNSISRHAILFENWESTSLYIKGEKYQGTISYSVMEYLCEMQKHVYEAYALVKYGVHDTRKLTADERQSLEIFVKVGEGSSVIDAIERSLTAFLVQLADKLTSRDKIIIVLGAVAIIYGASAYKAHLQYRLEAKKVELEADEDNKDAQVKLELLSRLKYAQESDIERDELLTKLSKTNADLAKIVQDGQELYHHRLRVASKTDTFSASEVAIDGDTASELLKAPRGKPVPVQLNGIYKVAKTDHQVMYGHIMTLSPVNGGVSFRAFLPELFAGGEHAGIIANAYRKRPIGVKVNGRAIGNKIISAEISGFYEPDPEPKIQANLIQ